MQKRLSQEMVQQKTRAENIKHLKSINFCGQDINNISLLKEMTNLEIISLSVNKIEKLQDIQYCLNAKEIYLRNNQISDFNELRYLQKLSDLKVLWLNDNPIASKNNYRETVLSILPNLEKLDNQSVTQEELSKTKSFKFSDDIVDDKQIFINNSIYEKPIGLNLNFNLNNSNQKKISINQQQNNVLDAILLLIKDLDRQSILILQNQLDKQLSNQC